MGEPSVSPEPTKGEEVIAAARVNLEVCCIECNGEAEHDRLIGEFESAVRAAYIPLVEAAREVDAMAAGDHAHWGGKAWKAWNCAWCRLRKALVQVPGQQQADTEQGGV